MYLEKLQIQGFKSFAQKNELVFPGMLDKTLRGLTAVVGPNGSGKSNVADSIRWALGEQSMKTLRGKKAEDIIFSGSDKKGKLSMAEVSLYLNNEDRQAPIDYSQIVITRRLYRNGESEYILNNNRVRLSDIQMLLAKSKFGQKTYSVIGQGTVEGFLNSSMAERKEFFDEATGVKQYQIKRDDALNKLKSSHENLGQAQMLVIEIEPRLKSLTRQVNKLQKRGELEIELRSKQLVYYGQLWQDNHQSFSRLNNEFLELEKIKIDKDKKLEALNKRLEQLEIESQSEDESSFLQDKLGVLERNRSELHSQLTRLETQLEMKLEASGKLDVSFLITRKEQIAKDIESISEEIITQEARIKTLQIKQQELGAARSQIDLEIDKLNDEIREITDKSDDEDIPVAKLEHILNQVRSLSPEAKITQFKELLQEVEKELIELIKGGSKGNGGTKQISGIHDRIRHLAREKEKVLIQVSENNLRLSARTERLKLLREKKESLSKESIVIEAKVEQHTKGLDYKELNKRQGEIKIGIKNKDEEINELKNKLDDIKAKNEVERAKLFALQREISTLQNDLNEVNNKLNNIKVDSTRFETKLEGLEIEIREELGGLREVKEYNPDEAVEMEKIRSELQALKRQLELIGGIDPAVEQEYNETKERFDFLSGQISDFSQAVDSLSKIIKELDVTIKKQFDKEFKVIASKFEEYFQILFSGGKARLVKVMDEVKDANSKEVEKGEEESLDKNMPDMADIKKIKFLQKHNATGLAGIEIQATPPGKKIQSISMLSGGERALTAIALISAIISANPSPFVVLDEVDAALDEANSERLAKILDDLSHKTQFIVITHNRASMRRASILYGVTMGDDGVSKLLSVKLEEAGGITKG